jgi:hypothetical protein
MYRMGHNSLNLRHFEIEFRFDTLGSTVDARPIAHSQTLVSPFL